MTQRTRRLGLVVAVAAGSALLAPTQHAAAIPANAPKIGMVCTPPTTPNVYNLVAKSGYTDTPDGNSVFMWSYANTDAPDNSHFQLPGPVMCVTEGASVSVHLHNTLPEPVSAVFPGQDSAVTASGGAAGLLTQEAPTGGDVTYTFTAGHPGTYLYESGSDVSKQIPMGLSGALVVRPTLGTNFAYDDPGSRFDPSREYLLLVNEIDPSLHHAVEVGGTYDYNATEDHYFTINGREFPDTIQDNGSSLLPNQPYGALVRIQPDQPGSQPALVRMLNAGALNHPFHPHGNHTTEIAQDGRELLSPTGASAGTEHFGETIGAGATEDFLLRWNDVDQFNPVNNPFPVAQPNYRTLTFKDGNTWYSGNPYLGYKGTLPVGTTSQNICGEWYFPWHSHALNEFTNFDQGFGGMGTLLRVDPPGGCFGFAASSKILTGTLKSGSVTNLSAADANYYQINSTTTGATRTTDFYTGFTGVPAGSANLKVTYQGTNCGPNPVTANLCPAVPAPAATQTVSVCNWNNPNGAVGCTTLTGAGATGWVTLPAPQGQAVPVATTLSAAIPNTAATTMTVASTAGTPPTGRFYVRVQNEVMQVTGVAGTTWTVVRHQLGTTAAAHPNGTAVTSEASTTWAATPAAGASYIGSGNYAGQARVLVRTQKGGSTSFSTWANLMKIVYDAP